MATVTTSDTANENAAIVMAIKPNSNDTILSFLSLILKCYPLQSFTFYNRFLTKTTAKVRLFAHTANNFLVKPLKKCHFVDTYQFFVVLNLSGLYHENHPFRQSVYPVRVVLFLQRGAETPGKHLPEARS